jgi:hypothetical protein
MQVAKESRSSPRIAKTASSSAPPGRTSPYLLNEQHWEKKGRMRIGTLAFIRRAR